MDMRWWPWPWPAGSLTSGAAGRTAEMSRPPSRGDSARLKITPHNPRPSEGSGHRVGGPAMCVELGPGRSASSPEAVAGGWAAGLGRVRLGTEGPGCRGAPSESEEEEEGEAGRGGSSRLKSPRGVSKRGSDRRLSWPLLNFPRRLSKRKGDGWGYMKGGESSMPIAVRYVSSISRREYTRFCLKHAPSGQAPVIQSPIRLYPL